MSYLEQLFIIRSQRYFALTLSVFGLAGMLCGYLWLGDERQQYRSLQLYHHQLRQQLVMIQKKAAVVPVTITPEIAVVTPVFSLVETLRQARGQLIHWQPDERQARLELSIAWEKVPFLFHHLAHCRGLTLIAFHITAASDAMAVVLALEFSYEAL